MILPYTSKFYSNGTIFDSFGELEQKYISYYIENDILYYLFEYNVCYAMNLKSEVVSGIALNYTTFLSGDLELNTECKTLVVKNGVAYGFDGQDAKLFRDEYVLYKKNDCELWRESLNRKSKDLLLSSTTEIRDFIIDDEDNFFVLHSKNKVTKFNKYREKQFTIAGIVSSLSSSIGYTDYVEFIKLDVVREYTENGLQMYPIILGNNSDGRHFLTKINEMSATLYGSKILKTYGKYQKTSSPRKINYNLTNYDYLKNTFKDKNKIIFKLRLKNIYNNRDILDMKIPIDIEHFKNGEHHFAFRMNTIKGKIDVFVDGIVYGSIDFPKANFSFQDLTQESFAVGATYFYNNLTLPQYLKQQKNYMLSNCSIRDFKLYDKAISNDEIKFLLIKTKGDSDLVASIPAGHRNEIEQIDRVFTVNTPGNKSNKVNIIIKNSNINNDVIKENVKAAIVERINKILPAGVSINDIVFKNTDIK